MGYGLLIGIVLIYTSFLIYRERIVFFKKNERIIRKIQEIKEIREFNQVWCSISSSKISTSGLFINVYFIKNCIILIEDYSLDLNINRAQYANTYIIKKKNSKTEIKNILFRNLSYIKELSLQENGKLILKTENHQQSVFKTITFYSFYNLSFEFSLPLNKEEVKQLLEFYDI
ncbi:MAG: hypothetical protein M3Q58_07570 [Bacteroidota bacterium]|nr:hypothetical protein [Bacteroidota bacterium]